MYGFLPYGHCAVMSYTMEVPYLAALSRTWLASIVNVTLEKLAEIKGISRCNVVACCGRIMRLSLKFPSEPTVQKTNMVPKEVDHASNCRCIVWRPEPLVDVVVCRIVDLMESKTTWIGLGLQPKLQVNMLRILRFLLKSLGGCLEEEVARDHNVELDMVDLEQLLNEDVSDVARRGIDVVDDATQGNSHKILVIDIEFGLH
ncbi:hypothetical protein V6N12_058161 [Hibiscus sabdariffa]|uniref:Uncharacterized protein n=1 Tax=Hibiscus sabdariffa TaxID=183260 RepID=A0ABR1ZNE4_9ROSI